MKTSDSKCNYICSAVFSAEYQTMKTRIFRIFSAATVLAILSLSSASATDLTLLPGLVVTSSSEYLTTGTNGPKANILDNDFSTYWNAGAYSGWVQVDFGSIFQFDRVEVYGNGNFSVSNTYSLLTSTDGSNWASIGAGTYHIDNNLLGSNKFGGAFVFSGTQPVGRYLRYDQTNGTEWSYLGELEVQGHTPFPPVPLPASLPLLISGLGLVRLFSRKTDKA